MKMLIKRIGVIILILAFMSISATSVSAIPCKCGDISVNETGWWRVGGSFNASNTPIQHAVDNVTDGETVCVKDGVYTENVNLNKRLTLRSENGSSSTMVQAATPTTSVIIVAANYVNLSGFMVTGANAGSDWIAGINLWDANYCNISNNNASYNFFGISVDSSSNNMLMNNIASSNKRGIFLGFSSYNTLADNTANLNSWEGIRIEDDSHNILLTNNTAKLNSESGISLWQSGNSVLTNNNVSNNNYGIHLYDADNNNISCNWVAFNNASGFYLNRSIGNTIEHNNIMMNGDYNTESGGYEWQLYNDQNYVVTAKNNYWGPGMNNSTIDASIYDDDEGKGKVEFYPFETGSFMSLTLSLAPLTDTNPTGTSHKLTATLVDADGDPTSSQMITFTVTAGPNAGTTGSGVTDSNGEATWSYTGTNAGMDTIVATCACETSNDAFKSWESCAITIESAYGSGTQNDIFQPGESVYATGSGYAASTTYNLYIVDDTTWTDGMLIPARIADTETSVTTDASGNIPAGTLIWSVCVEGKYDIVVDVNGDGDYDAGIDALDTNVDVSFKEIPEFSTIAIPVVSILGLLFFFNHRKRRKEQ